MKQGVLITRPLSQALDLKERLQEEGYIPYIAPLLDIQELPSSLPPLNQAQALIFTSQQAIEIFSRRSEERSIPIWCVGEVSAKKAKNLGFRDVSHTQGGAKELADHLCDHQIVLNGQWIHFCGEDVHYDLAAHLKRHGFDMMTCQLYKAVFCDDFSLEILEALTRGQIQIVLFYSARTIINFLNLCKKEEICDLLSKMTALCLSLPMIQSLDPSQWKKIMVAQSPTTESMLEALREL